MKTKALISFAVTAKLICVFFFANAKSPFSHDAAQMKPFHTKKYHYRIKPPNDAYEKATNADPSFRIIMVIYQITNLKLSDCL